MEIFQMVAFNGNNNIEEFVIEQNKEINKKGS